MLAPRQPLLVVGVLVALACGERQVGVDDGVSTTSPGESGSTDEATATNTGTTGEGSETGDTTGDTTSPDTGDTTSPDTGETGDPAPECFSFAVSAISGPTPQVLWQHLEPGSGRFRDLVVGPDGTAYATGDGERQLVALDADGNELWALADEADEAQGIALAGRLIVGGHGHYGATDHPDWLRIYDLAGALIDELVDPDGDDAFWHVEASEAGEILVGGRYWGVDPSLRVALYEPDLSLRWAYTTQPVGGNSSSSPPQVAFDGGGRAHASFRFEPPETRQVLRFDAAGEVEWIADLVGAPLPTNAWPGALAFVGGEQLVVAGRASSVAWLGLFTADGQPQWSATYGGQPWDEIQAIVARAGGFAVAGELAGGQPGCSQCRDAWLAGLDDQGAVLWSAFADGDLGLNDEIYAMARAANGDLVVAGRVQCDGPEPGERPFVARLRP